MSPPRPGRALERALIVNTLVHVLALASMVALLLPALPGGNAPDDLARVSYIAAHPWLFRLGWLPWQGCALGDLLLAIAMVRTPWLARAASWVTLALTVLAVIPDQTTEALWISEGVALAQTDATAYLAFERTIFPFSAGVGALFYTFAAIGWSVAFAKAKVWSRWLTIISVVAWPLMIVASLAPMTPLLPDDLRAHVPSASAAFVSGANAVGFALIQAWLVLGSEMVLRRARPDSSWSRLAPWRHPRAGLLGRALDVIANSRLLHALLDVVPVPAMRSDITDVVYVNYLVPAEKLAPLLPAGLSLQVLPGDRALFTFLTFRHGHFGFSFLGPLRKMLPSPVQSNWRIHVVDDVASVRGIHFVTTALDHTLYALVARTLTAGTPMHVPATATLARSPS
ncbi:MAG TPA: DUF2071 domain-containing protein, partial [Myxococcota bacterium]